MNQANFDFHWINLEIVLFLSFDALMLMVFCCWFDDAKPIFVRIHGLQGENVRKQFVRINYSVEYFSAKLVIDAWVNLHRFLFKKKVSFSIIPLNRRKKSYFAEYWCSQ